MYLGEKLLQPLSQAAHTSILWYCFLICLFTKTFPHFSPHALTFKSAAGDKKAAISAAATGPSPGRDGGTRGQRRSSLGRMDEMRGHPREGRRDTGAVPVLAPPGFSLLKC